MSVAPWVLENIHTRQTGSLGDSSCFLLSPTEPSCMFVSVCFYSIRIEVAMWCVGHPQELGRKELLVVDCSSSQ